MSRAKVSITAGMLVLAALIWAQAVHNQGITVFVDGTEFSYRPDGFVEEDSHQLYVPVYFAAEALGGELFWRGDKRTVYIKKDHTCLVLPVGDGRPVVNGQVQERGEPARVLRGGVYAQMKYLSEVLGYSFAWREDDRTVELNAQPSVAREITRPRYADFHQQGMVTFSYDDGWASHYSLAYPLHLKYNLPASFNIVTGWTDTTNRYMTSQQLKEIARAGFEIASHSDTHPNRKGRFFKDLTAEEASSEVIASRDKLVGWGLPRVEGFVVPGSVHGDWLVPIIGRYYRYTRCLKGRTSPDKPVESGRSRLLEYTPDLDRADLPSFAVVNGQSAEDVIKLIDKAVAEKKWLILMVHKLGNDKNDIYTWNQDKLERILQYIAAKPRSELLTVPLQDGVRFATGLGDYRCGSITAAASTGQAAAGDRVLLMSKGFDDSGVQVPTASGFLPRWEVVAGDAELEDYQDGTALLTVTGPSDVVVRCSDAADPTVCSYVQVLVK